MGWAAAWLRVGLLSACRSRKCSDHEDGATIISHAPTPPGGRQPPRDSNRLRAWRISEPGRRIATSEKPHRCRVAQFLRIDRRVILDAVAPRYPRTRVHCHLAHNPGDLYIVSIHGLVAASGGRFRYRERAPRTGIPRVVLEARDSHPTPFSRKREKSRLDFSLFAALTGADSAARFVARPTADPS